MLIDTHAHLNDEKFNADRGAVIARAGELGIQKIVEIACAPGEWALGEKLTAAYPDKVRCAFGVHPEYIKDFTPAALPELEKYLQTPCAVAVGEIGLDYYWDDHPRDLAQGGAVGTAANATAALRQILQAGGVPRPQRQGIRG